MSRKKQLLGLAAAGTGVLLGAYYAASPWLTVNKLKQAFEKKDTRQIEKIVDFPELREDFKEVAKATIMKNANNSWSSKELTTEEFKPSPDLSVKMNYTDLNEFKIELSNKKVIAEPISLFMEREGFADWKVTGIDIPQSIFNSTY